MSHVFCTRRVAGVGPKYHHHGIYVNDNEVIHYDGILGKKKLKSTSLDDFKGKSKTFQEIKHSKKHSFAQDEVVNRARSKLNSPPKYNVVKSNCEHFANWCTTGNNVSYQVLYTPLRLAKFYNPKSATLLSFGDRALTAAGAQKAQDNVQARMYQAGEQMYLLSKKANALKQRARSMKFPAAYSPRQKLQSN